MATEAFRLPTTTRPVHYHTQIAADPAKETFSGTVRIDVVLDEPTAALPLHARGLDVEHAAWVRDGTETAADKVTVEAARETITLHFDGPVPSGEATLVIRYTGTVARNMEGLYLSKDGDEVCLATQCEATDARAILPCFDEPMFKARFGWEIRAPSEHTVLANGGLEDKTEHDDGTTTWRFRPTPRMSSYLCAFAIGPFHSTPEAVGRDIPFRVWALAGKERHGEHARDFSVRLIDWYEDYFGVPYPFDKYDQIAVPSFSFGAMENPGLVVFRASLLLLDPQTASWNQRKQIDLVVAHEFAHMWFGNLVTMAWWDDLWLNEAFAEWIAHKAVHALHPEHEVWFPFQDRAGHALHTDSLAGTHAIYFPVETPEEAQELFDSITYGKGSAVMNMLESYLSPEAFREGLRTYMAAFAEKNARGSDLWHHLGEASHEPVGDIMQSWVAQPGHPVVEVAYSADADGARVKLSQTRARASPTLPASDTRWMVPMVLRYTDDAGEHEHRHLLTNEQETIDLDVQGTLRWLHADADDTGVFRTAPDAALRERLIEHYRALRPAERRGLLRDQWYQVRAGGPLAPYLDFLVKAVAEEDHYAVMGQIVGSLRGLEGILEEAGDTEALTHYRAWVARTMRPHLEKLGVEPSGREDPRDGQRRAHLVRAVAGIGQEPDTVATMRGLAEKERADPALVDPDIAGVAVAVNAQMGDASTFDAHLATYKDRRDAHASPQETDRYLHTFASFREPGLVDRVLTLFTEDVVPNQSIGPLLRMMLGTPHAGRQSWAWVKEHWGKVREELGDAWTGILVDSAGDLPPDLADDVETFFDAKLDGLAKESYKRAKESLAHRQELYDRVMDDLVAWAKGL